MAERRSSGHDRTVYRGGPVAPRRASANHQSRAEGRDRQDRSRRGPTQARPRRSLARRILLAVLVVIVVAAVAFGIGYLIGLYLAVLPAPAL